MSQCYCRPWPGDERRRTSNPSSSANAAAARRHGQLEYRSEYNAGDRQNQPTYSTCHGVIDCDSQWTFGCNSAAYTSVRSVTLPDIQNGVLYYTLGGFVGRVASRRHCTSKGQLAATNLYRGIPNAESLRCR